MKMREGRLRWYGHIMKRDQEYVGRRMMEMELLGKREAKEKISRCSKKDMKEVGVREKDIENRTLWKNIICSGNPRLKGKTERRKPEFLGAQLDFSGGIGKFFHLLTALCMYVKKLKRTL